MKLNYFNVKMLNSGNFHHLLKISILTKIYRNQLILRFSRFRAPRGAPRGGPEGSRFEPRGGGPRNPEMSGNIQKPSFFSKTDRERAP